MPKWAYLRQHKILDETQHRVALLGRVREGRGGLLSNLRNCFRDTNRTNRSERCSGHRHAVAARCTRQEQRVARTSKSLSQKRRVCKTNFHHGADINANFTPSRTEARKIGCAWDYSWHEAKAGARGLSISRNADMWHMAGLVSR